MKKGVLLVLLMIFCAHVSAQRSCGTEEYMNEMMKDPAYAKQWAKNQEKLQNELARRANLGRSSFAMNEIVIPVAVHFPEGSEADRACLEDLARDQIDILNGDFTATNPDANLWTAASAFYPGVVHGVANIKFCIATQNHPPGFDVDLLEGEPAVTVGEQFSDGNYTTSGLNQDPAWQGYLNIVVSQNTGSGVLGFSPFNGNLNLGQAVVINANNFGSGAGCPGVVPQQSYDLGRTATHELGHFFSLRHVWGDGPCGVDDEIADTPEADGENYGCPDPGDFAGCVAGEFELSMNYMDYTEDACMYMFSQGQIDVVDAYVAGVLEAQFKPNTVPFCVETPEYTMTDGLINTCNGIFYDSGGADADYSNLEDEVTFTICPENPGQVIQLDFTSFSTQLNLDILTIYNADNADDSTTIIGEYSGTDPADSPGLVAATTTNASGCLTLVFSSNGFGVESGWQANISCQDPPTACQTVLAQLDSAFPEPNAEGYILVCPGEEITLSGSGTFSEPGGGDGATYQWETGDGTVIDGQTATFSYDTPGVYLANLNIWDTNTSILPEGCKNTNLINQIILVSTTPDFTATVPDQDPLCFGATTSITAVVTPTTFNNDCTPPESVQTFLPDGDGDRYTTCITVNCFQSDQVIENISNLVDICLNIEHSYIGDLEIFITSPNGVQVALHYFYGGFFNQYLGGANDDGTLQPGVGADYCFSMAGNETLINGDLIIAGSNPPRPSIRPGIYLPEESFENLIGSPLNGNWCIEVVDNLPADNGYIFFWELNFDPALTPANLSFTPEIVSGSWADDSSIAETNGDTITIAPPTEGQYCYTYTVVDDFDCEYTHEVCVDVLPEIIFDVPSNLFVCDSPAPPYVFDLSQNEATMLASNPNPEDYVVTFHNDITAAENDTGAIMDTTAYSGTVNEEIFVRFEYLDSNCFVIESFQLKLIDLPQIFAAQDIVKCDDLSNDGVEFFDLDERTSSILGTQLATDYEVTYHIDLASAEAGTANLTSPYLSTSDAQGIYVRVQPVGGGGCFIVSPDPLFYLIVTNKATAVAPENLSKCDSSGTGALEATFDLEQQTATILGALQDPSTFTVTYHSDPTDAESGDSPLVSPLTTTSRTIYVRVEEDGLPDCYETTEFELIVNPNPEVTDQSATACSASTVGLTLADDVDGPSVASYDLTSITPEAGLAADASNAVLGTNLASDAIASDVWTNTTATPLDVVYSFTPVSSDNCIGEAFTVTVTVNPNPEVSDQSATVCSASTVGLTLADDVDGPSVVSYDLTSIAPEAGLAADASNALLGTNLASDAIALDVWTNTTATPLDVVYSFTPVSSDNCTGSAFTVTVTINSNPEVTDQSATVCSASTLGLTLADDLDGPSVVSYDLTSIAPEAGLAADASNALLGTNLASDAIALDVWTNTTATPLDVVYSFTPVSSDNCTGSAFTVTVTINSNPEVTDQSATVCSASTLGLTLADDLDGPSVVSYDLTSITPEAGLAADASNAVLGTNLASDAIALDVWTNTTATPLDVVYSFIPYDAIGCIGAAFTVTFTINPEPEVTDQIATVCSASTVGLTLADDVDGPSVASYDLTSIAPEAGLAADASNAVLGTNLASDAIASDVWTNTTATPLDVVYSFTPVSSDNCIGEAFTVTVTVNPEPEVTDQSAIICSASTVGLTLADDVDGPSVSSYDLTAITPSAGLAADASNAVLGTNLASDAIASDVWTNTTATPLDVVYSFTPVSSENCIGVAFTVTVTVNPEPEVTDQSATVCSASTVGLTLADDVDGPFVASYDLTSITPEAGLAADASNAVLGTNLASDAIASDVWTNTTATPLDVVYSFTPVSSDNCTGAAFTVTVTVNPLPVPAPAFIDSKCDDDTDGLQTFDMSGVAAQVLGAQTDMVVSYHLTLTDAENNTAALGDNITTTTPNLQTIHIRLENTLTNCYATSTIDLVVDPLPEIDLEGNYVICSDATGGGLDYVVVDPGLSPATYNFIWRDELGDVLSTDSTYTVDQGGIYSLEVSFASTAAGCSAPLEIFTVSESGAPAVTVDVVTEAFADTHVVVATAVGTGIYEFSLDQGPWLDSGTFIGVDPGDHTVYVRDVNGCGVTATMIYIVDYPKYFTPNGDGYHDTWNIDALSSQLGSKIYIFDRYGKLLKQITPAGEGWDGTYNGQQMPTTDYWFMLEYNDLNTGVPKQLKAHFSLKR